MNCYLLLVEMYQLSQLLLCPAMLLFLAASGSATVVVQGSVVGAIRSTTSLSCLLGSKGQVQGSPEIVKIV